MTNVANEAAAEVDPEAKQTSLGTLPLYSSLAMTEQLPRRRRATSPALDAQAAGGTQDVLAALTGAPDVPQAREHHRLMVSAPQAIALFAMARHWYPFIEGVGRNQAALVGPRMPKHSIGCSPLNPGVNGAHAAWSFGLFRPGRKKAPVVREQRRLGLEPADKCRAHARAQIVLRDFVSHIFRRARVCGACRRRPGAVRFGRNGRT